jgi:hypothetical protein
MRRQAVENDVFPLEITDEGVRVHDSAASFSLLNSDWNVKE